MATILVQANLVSRTTDPEDTIVNTYVFSEITPGSTEQAASDALTVVQGFYRGLIGATGRRLEQYLNGTFNEYDLKAYDISDHLDGSNFGSPIDEQVGLTRTAVGNTANSLPNEVAAVLRFHAVGRDAAPVESPDGADPGTAVDRPRQRRTGRVYLGPLNYTALDSNNSNFIPRLHGTFISDVVNAAGIYLDQLANSLNLVQCVWSRTDGNARDVVKWSIDNEPDTMRSRGFSASATVQWPL